MFRRSLEGETYIRPDSLRRQEGQQLDNAPTELLEFTFPDVSTYEQLATPKSPKFIGDVRWVDIPGLTSLELKVDGKVVRIKEFGVQSLHGVDSQVARHPEERVEGFCTLQGTGVMEKSGRAVHFRHSEEEWNEELRGGMTNKQLATARFQVLSDGSIRVVLSEREDEQLKGQEQVVRPVVTLPGQTHGTRTKTEILVGLNWIGEVVR